jgi:hypothetical protein
VIGDGDDDAHRLHDPAGRQVGQGSLDGGNQFLIGEQSPNGLLIENDDSVYLFG